LWRVYDNVVFFNLERPYYHKEDNAIPCFGADRRRDALARYSVPLILIGMTGFVLSSGNFVAATIFPEPAAAAEAVFLAAAGMNGIGGIFFSLGFTAIFFAMASREEYNSMLANIAALVAVLAFVLSIIGFASTELGELMTQLVGVTYIVHTIYAVYIGRGLLTRE